MEDIQINIPDEPVVVGLMSGTSLDGLDIVSVRFKKADDKWSYAILKSETIPIPDVFLEHFELIFRMNGADLNLLSLQVGNWMGDEVAEFIRKLDVAPHFISSHGHTVFHQPEKKLTIQIGNPWAIHQKTGLPVVSDFRSLDVVLGGQGAPLVPIGDQQLFGDFAACVNLGGISNISYESAGKRIAYDIGPCNMVFNFLAKKLGRDFDRGGSIARSGGLCLPYYNYLKNLDYFKQPGPKSLGYEWVKAKILDSFNQWYADPEDLMHTSVQHTADSIAGVIQREVNQGGRILFTGGGTFNTYLMEEIKARLHSSHDVHIPPDEVIHFKEALVFAFLGLLKLRGEVNVLSSVTGATFDSCSGIIYQGIRNPKKKRKKRKSANPD